MDNAAPGRLRGEVNEAISFRRSPVAVEQTMWRAAEDECALRRKKAEFVYFLFHKLSSEVNIILLFNVSAVEISLNRLLLHNVVCVCSVLEPILRMRGQVAMHQTTEKVYKALTDPESPDALWVFLDKVS